MENPWQAEEESKQRLIQKFIENRSQRLAMADHAAVEQEVIKDQEFGNYLVLDEQHMDGSTQFQMDHGKTSSTFKSQRSSNNSEYGTIMTKKQSRGDRRQNHG